MKFYNAYCDGGSRNNTHAACAWLICDEDNKVLYSNSCYLGAVSNNCAEYQAIIMCLISALAGGTISLKVHQDSELVSRQINGQYAVKAQHLKPMWDIVKHLENKFEHIEFTWVPREHPLISACDKSCDQVIELYKK